MDATRVGALAHDLGHAPFGHHGEEVLQAWAEGRGLDDSFEGNAQTLRILTKNAIRRGGMEGPQVGLNWSWRSLAATVKYPWLRAEDGDGLQRDKWGAYRTEADVLEAILEYSPPPGRRSQLCIEAQLMDWADDISYAVHDVADFFIVDLIPLNDIDKWEGFCGRADTKANVRSRFLANGHEENEFAAAFEAATLDLPGYFPTSPPSRAAATSMELRAFESAVITTLTDGVVVDEAGDLTITSDQRVRVELLKEVTSFFVWRMNQRVRSLQDRQEDLLRDLLEHLAQDVEVALNGWEPPDPTELESPGWMPHETGNTQLCHPLLEYFVVEALYEGQEQGRDREKMYLRGILDFLCSQTDAQVVQLAIDQGLLDEDDRDAHLYI